MSVHCSAILWLSLHVLYFQCFFSFRRSNWWQRFGDALSTKGTHKTHCTCESRFMFKQFSIYCFSMKFSESQRETERILLLTVHIDKILRAASLHSSHLPCSITYRKQKCEREMEWERGVIKKRLPHRFCVGCHWLPYPYLYLSHTTRQHFIVQDWNVIFVWWQINYKHFFLYLCLTRSHRLFAEHRIKGIPICLHIYLERSKQNLYPFSRNFT